LSNIEAGLGQGVQCSRLKTAETALVKGLQLLYNNKFLHPKSEVGYLDNDQYINEFKIVVTFESLAQT
jgi:hypothetical protein